jgi:hypothetical protein
MAKRKPMGESAAGLFGQHTAAEALQVIAGGQGGAAPKKGKRASKSSAPIAADAGERKYMVTTIRITPEHWKALRDSANERVAERGGGKADASEVLRDVLDEWMTKRR